ncbi:MAG: hypothetical protein JWO58_3210 [Chitinophagaceae bacterium]|nr:hypothetical protein [Chitinophagaceae bacterium]
MKKIVGLVLLVGTLVQLSCKRNTDHTTPDLCPSDAFVVTVPFSFQGNVSGTSNLNLSGNGYAQVGMTFNESIDYKVTISGTLSGAHYVYTGKGSTIDLKWYGNATNGICFQSGDDLMCSVTNLCYKEALGSGALQLTSLISYNAGNWVKGANFEDSPAVSPYPNNTDPRYNTPPDTIIFGSSLASSEPSPQGGQYLKIAATSTLPTWYFGGLSFSGFTPALYASLKSDPANVYLNFFAKGTANSQAQFILTEKVYGSILKRKFLASVSSGWKLYSVKLSDIGIINPSGIISSDIDLGSATHMDTSAEVEVDLVLFTFGAPL